jgi:Post-segregation antitoxin CcdA
MLTAHLGKLVVTVLLVAAGGSHAPARSSPPAAHRHHCPVCAYNVRMPRINVYLPTDLYQQVKAEDLPVSEICKRALRRELAARRRRHTSQQPPGDAGQSSRRA